MYELNNMYGYQCEREWIELLKSVDETESEQLSEWASGRVATKSKK